MKEFRPAFLYIKQHKITGLKYFGKTIQKNPERYRGSGVYWNNHLKTHSNDVDTIWYCLFLDQNSITEFALNFSKQENISESAEWANLRLEDGLDGNSNPSNETRLKMSKSASILRGRKCSNETKDKMSEKAKLRVYTEEDRIRMSEGAKKRKPMTTQTKLNMAIAQRLRRLYDRNTRKHSTSKSAFI